MDDYRFGAQRSPPRSDRTTMNSLVSPPRNGNPNRLSQPPPAHDSRSTLPRRFTADSGRVPTMSSIINGQRMPDGPELNGQQAFQKVQLLEKKRLEYERIREQRRRFELEMLKLDQAQRREELELAQMTEDIRLSGQRSEPTTPPEYRETTTGFPTMFSRPNRYSLSSLTSPPGMYQRQNRSSSIIASQNGNGKMNGFGYEDGLPSRSTPGSRRNSDEDEKEEAVRQDPSSHRTGNTLNRYSMPVTKSRNGFYDFGLDQANTTRFLFGDEEANNTSTADQLYSQAATDDAFPTLVRREDSGTMTSASDGSKKSSRPSSVRHSLELKTGDMKPFDGSYDGQATSAFANRGPPKLQASFSASDIPTVKNTGAAPTVAGNFATNAAAQQYLQNHNAAMGRIPAGAMPNRQSREMTLELNSARENLAVYQNMTSNLQGSAPAFGLPTTQAASTTAALAAETNGAQVSSIFNGTGAFASTPAAYGVPNGLSASATTNFAGTSGFITPNMFSPTTAFPNSAPNNFGLPGLATSGGNNYPVNGTFPVTPANPYGVPPSLPTSYSMPHLSMSMQSLNMNGSAGATNGYTPPAFNPYASMYMPGNGPGAVRDSQARVIQSRRAMDGEAMSRFNNLPLDQVQGHIYELCKDQHGCRYLQKQLETRSLESIRLIWAETNPHVIELMTDPFGNYLCQKLLEYCDDEQRTVLIQNAALDMVRIAINQHGTRALQKMIEFVSTPQQINIIIEALRFRVVELIQDLNGNHVIQKCLNKLSAKDAEFIFHAVGDKCVEVGTHRHGCCVLQRCIDHASGTQKQVLIHQITQHAVNLVQDPFGNYVVQYIIDLNESMFTEPLVAQFKGRIIALSRHKFSSNVVEKCLRCSQDASRDMIVEELLNPHELERLLRDSFANYVVQTALEHATFYMKQQLVDMIRPLLPAIRSTPYGRRIQAKVQAYDAGSNVDSGLSTPADVTNGQISIRPPTVTANGFTTDRPVSSSNSINGSVSNGIGATALSQGFNGGLQTVVANRRNGIAPGAFASAGVNGNGLGNIMGLAQQSTFSPVANGVVNGVTSSVQQTQNQYNMTSPPISRPFVPTSTAAPVGMGEAEWL